jgi:hypothetical protein
MRDSIDPAQHWLLRLPLSAREPPRRPRNTCALRAASRVVYHRQSVHEPLVFSVPCYQPVEVSQLPLPQKTNVFALSVFEFDCTSVAAGPASAEAA